MAGNVRTKPLRKAWWFWAVLGVISTILFCTMGACTDSDTDTDYDDYYSNGNFAVTTTLQETTVFETTAEVTTAQPTTAEETTAKPTETEIVTEAPMATTVITHYNEEPEGDYGYVRDFPVVEEVPVEDNGQNYVLNTNTHKFHYPSCSSAKRIKESNREDFYGTREEAIELGYDPCKICYP